MLACEMIPPYINCEECKRFPNGYPEGEYFKISYGGDCWIAYSTTPDNEYNPENYIGNTDINKPWVVLKFFPMIEWVVANKS